MDEAWCSMILLSGAPCSRRAKVRGFCLQHSRPLKWVAPLVAHESCWLGKNRVREAALRNMHSELQVCELGKAVVLALDNEWLKGEEHFSNLLSAHAAQYGQQGWFEEKERQKRKQAEEKAKFAADQERAIIKARDKHIDALYRREMKNVWKFHSPRGKVLHLIKTYRCVNNSFGMSAVTWCGRRKTNLQPPSHEPMRYCYDCEKALRDWATAKVMSEVQLKDW